MNKTIKELALTRGSTLFLRLAVLAAGAVVLALCIFALPAVWVDTPKEYPQYPEVTTAMRGILIMLYFTAIPFFVAVYQTLRLLSYVDKNQAFSELSVHSLKVIKYCALTISGAFAASLPLFYIWADKDDAPGLIVIGMIMSLAPLAVAVLAAVLQRLLRQAITMKSENELTV